MSLIFLHHFHLLPFPSHTPAAYCIGRAHWCVSVIAVTVTYIKQYTHIHTLSYRKHIFLVTVVVVENDNNIQKVASRYLYKNKYDETLLNHLFTIDKIAIG